jgi:hypothetical protein
VKCADGSGVVEGLDVTRRGGVESWRGHWTGEALESHCLRVWVNRDWGFGGLRPAKCEGVGIWGSSVCVLRRGELEKGYWDSDDSLID